ncbi:MAG: hypothetical protein ACLGIV_00650 [Actinomycetes bacterium]
MTEAARVRDGRRAPTGRTVHRTDPDGTVRDWLVSPVWSRPCRDLDDLLDAEGEPWGPDGRWVLTNGPDVAPLKGRLHRLHPLVVDQTPGPVVEGAPLRWETVGGMREATWARRHVASDGYVDWSEFCFTPEYRESVAATVVEVDQAEERVLEVSCTGPFACWVDGRLVLQDDGFSYMEPRTSSVRLRLSSGTTEIVVSTWQVAFRECRHILRLRVLGLPVRVVVPNPAADEHRSTVAERVLEQVGSPRWAVSGDSAELTGPPGAALRVTVDGRDTHRVSLAADGRAEVAIVQQRDDAVRPGPAVPASAEGEDVASASMLSTGETVLDVRLDDDETPVTRRLFVARLPRRHRSQPTGGPDQWRAEVLQHVAGHAGTSAAALAKAVLGAESHAQVAELDATDVEAALSRITTRGDCADFEVVGLMHLWHRVPEQAWPTELRNRVESALVGMKYWITQPGLDAMCYFTENHQLVWHVAQRLVGGTWPDTRFEVDGRTGAEHAEEGGRRAAAWIRRKLDGGFSEFDSNAYLAIDALALVSLVELDDDPDLRSAAEALLDKTLLTLASNSWRGVHGAAHGRSYVHTLRSSRFEETAPILWLLAGVGALNSAVLPVTALATARTYRAPQIVRRLAGDQPEQWWGRQVYRGEYAFERDLLSRPYGSDLRVWRTPGAMLSSVQDYRAGLPGLQEHIWGATLGSEVQVFATHPANADNGSSARPNAWAGQRVLPHARQDRDAVLAVHRFPEGDPEARTHLWLPVALCDEWRRHGAWLAARVGRGFVAVATPGGVRPVEAGDTAWQEWTPVGPGTAWVATVASTTQDDPSAAFAAWSSRLAEPVEEGDRVSWTAPDGRTLQLSWDGAFLRDGVAVDLDGRGLPEDPPHLDNPSCTSRFGDARLEAEWDGERLVLDLDAGRRLEPASAVGHGHDVQAGGSRGR